MAPSYDWPLALCLPLCCKGSLPAMQSYRRPTVSYQVGYSSFSPLATSNSRFSVKEHLHRWLSYCEIVNSARKQCMDNSVFSSVVLADKFGYASLTYAKSSHVWPIYQSVVITSPNSDTEEISRLVKLYHPQWLYCMQAEFILDQSSRNRSIGHSQCQCWMPQGWYLID